MADWTDDRVALLVQCIKDKKSASETGEELGVSRGSVTGKAKRMGLSFQSQPPSVRGEKYARKERRRTQTVRVANPFPYKPDIRVIEEAAPSLQEFNAAIPASQRVDIWGLEKHHCRYIVGDPPGDYFYCGGTVDEGETYCPGHRPWLYERSRH